MKDKTILFTMLFILFLVVAVPVVTAKEITIKEDCPIWWNPLTWFGDCKEYKLEKSPEWIMKYSDNPDMYPIIVDSKRQDSDIYLCSKTATKKNDLKNLDFATSFKTEAKELKSKDKLKAIEYEGKYCYYYKPQPNEKFLKFDKHSTHLVYTNESISLSNENGVISTLSLITEDYDYKNGKPNINPGIGKEQLTHIFHITNYSNEAITNLRAVDMRTNLEVERNLNLKYLTYELEEVSTYSYCSYDSLMDGSCESEVNGSYFRKRDVWKDFNGQDGEDYIIGVFADTKQGDYIDLDFNYYGVSVLESPIDWATWTADLNNGIISYWKFDEDSGSTAYDSLFKNNATITGATINQTGLINKSFFFDDASERVSDDDISGITSTGLSGSMWVNLDNANAYDTIIYFQDASPSVYMELRFDVPGTSLVFNVYDATNGESSTSVSYSGYFDKWTHIYWEATATTKKLYLDGVSKMNVSITWNTFSGIDNFNIGNGFNDGRGVNGYVDEVGLWNRTLTSDEITSLYNDGDGITYSVETTPTPTLNLTIDKTSPQTYGETINVSCTTDSNSTLTGYINDSAITLNTNIQLGAGYYEIKCNTTENDYWNSAENETTFTINKATPTGTITGTSPIGFGTAANVEGTESNTGDSDVNYTLYRNSTYVSNPDTNDSLPVGVYGYVYNTTGGANYSANSSMDSFTLEVTSIPVAEVTLYSPPDGYQHKFAPFSLSLTCGVEVDGSDVVNVSLLIDGVVNQTNTSGIGNVNYTFSEIFNDGNYTWTCRAYNNFSLATTAVSRYFNVNSTPFISFIGSTPINDTELAVETFTVDVNITQSYVFDTFKNWTVALYNSTGLVSSTTYTNATRSHTFTFPREGNYYYNATTWTTTSQLNNTETRYISTDFEAPSVNILSPADGFVVTEFNQSIDLNWSISDVNLESCLYGHEYINPEINYYDGTYWDSGLLTGWIYVTDHTTQNVTFKTIEYFGSEPYLRIYKDALTKSGDSQNESGVGNYSYNLELNENGWHYFEIYAQADAFSDERIEQFGLTNPESLPITLTNVTCSDNTTTFNYPTQNPESFLIFLYANDTFGNIGYDNLTIYKNTTAPIITITSPVENYDVLNNGDVVDLNFTISGNVTTLDECWYEYNNTNTTINCSENTNFTYIAGNDSLRVWVNDTLGNYNSSQKDFIIKVYQDSVTYTTPVLTTQNTTIDFNVIIGDNYNMSNATLNYNSVNQVTHIINNGGNNYTLRTFVLAPNTEATYDFYMNFTVNGSSIISDTYQQVVSPVNFSICGGYNNVSFLTVTFEDESNGTILNVSNAETLIRYWIDDEDNYQTYSFSDISENPNYSFCFLPSNENVTINMTLKYYSTGYPQRTWAFNARTLSNETTNETLYLLADSYGNYINFQTINLADQPISDVASTVELYFLNTYTLISEQTTSDAGIVSFWLDPDSTYRYNFSKAGYDSYSSTFQPTYTDYTIPLGETTTSAVDCSSGFLVSTKPTSTYLNNGTDYTFNLTLSSNVWTVTDWGFTLYYQNGTEIADKSSSANGGILTQLANTGNDTGIYMSYYYITDNCTINGTRTWYIENTDGQDFSIVRFFEDLSSYTNAGMFGFDDFGNAVLIVIIMVLSVGLLTYRYGVQSESALIGFLFALILFLDIGIGFIPTLQIGNGIPLVGDHLVSFISGLILLGFILKEELR